jgi:YD repeat-containing protein
MSSSRLALLAVLLVSFFVSFSSQSSSAILPTAAALDSPFISYHGPIEEIDRSKVDDHAPGIKEDIPAKFTARYEEWKSEFLSTEAGRKQWNYYQTNPNFALTITMSRENAEGATTGKYRWNDAGQLVAATITLGSRLDEGYPNPIYFPVMNSLVPTETSSRIGGSTLAATKLAHEFGHVNRTGKVDGSIYQLQAQLIPQYNKIFLANGRNADDPKLIELVQKLGGTPVEIWEDREYWGEANAMVYLQDRFSEDSLRCSLFSRIRHSVDLYAKNYEPRFLEVIRATPNRKLCGWQ